MIKLTQSQIYTLRRIRNGTLHRLRGDGKEGYECRPVLRSGIPDHVNAPSLPPLYRMGLIGFSYGGDKDTSRWYNIHITPAGRQALKDYENN